MKAPVYIVDIDGTVADCSHRLHFIKDTPKDWDAFFRGCINDKPIKQVIQTIESLALTSRIIFSTGRSDAVEYETCAWLFKHTKIPIFSVYMRKAGDHREDYIVKSELLDLIIKELRPGEEITGVFEDRQQVVDMYRKRGLKVFQVSDGDF